MTMLYAPIAAPIEVRAAGDGSRIISGSFPYNATATLSAGGGLKGGPRPRKERFAKRAFSYAIDDAKRDIALLIGHDFSKVLARKLTGSLKLNDSDDALRFEARISPEAALVSHVSDALNMLAAGLIGGISPGFMVPPKSAVPDAERTEVEDPSEGRALIRTITAAVLFELSLVTRPAYSQTQVEARSWSLPAHIVPFRMRAMLL